MPTSIVATALRAQPSASRKRTTPTTNNTNNAGGVHGGLPVRVAPTCATAADVLAPYWQQYWVLGAGSGSKWGATHFDTVAPWPIPAIFAQTSTAHHVRNTVVNVVCENKK